MPGKNKRGRGWEGHRGMEVNEKIARHVLFCVILACCACRSSISQFAASQVGLQDLTQLNQEETDPSTTHASRAWQSLALG